MIRTRAAPNEASNVLRELIQDLMRNTGTRRHFMEGGRKTTRRCALLILWANGRLAAFDPKTGPTVDLA